jgi:hypothetical protein
MTEQTREQTGQGDEPASIEAPPAADGSVSPRGAIPPEKQKAARRRKLLTGAAGALVLVAVLALGIPWILNAVNTAPSPRKVLTPPANEAGSFMPRALVAPSDRNDQPCLSLPGRERPARS